MKIVKESTGKYKEKEYSRAKISISEKVLKEAQLKYGDNLKTTVEKNKIILSKK